MGNALGAMLSGLAIGAGLGFTSPLWVGALFSVAALFVLGVATAASYRTRRRPSTARPPAGEKLVVACHDCAMVPEPEHGYDDRRLGATICSLPTSAPEATAPQPE